MPVSGRHRRVSADLVIEKNQQQASPRSGEHAPGVSAATLQQYHGQLDDR